MAGWNQQSMKRGLIKPTIEVAEAVPAEVVPVVELSPEKKTDETQDKPLEPPVTSNSK